MCHTFVDIVPVSEVLEVVRHRSMRSLRQRTLLVTEREDAERISQSA